VELKNGLDQSADELTSNTVSQSHGHCNEWLCRRFWVYVFFV